MNERKRLKWDYTKTIRDYCGHEYDDKHAFFSNGDCFIFFKYVLFKDSTTDG